MSEEKLSNRTVVLHARVVTGTGGGPDKTILNSSRFLRNLGYESVCAYLHPQDDPGFEELRRRAELLDSELISIPDRGLKDFSVISRLLKICREQNVSIWHGHDYKSDALGLLLRRFHPMKLVSTVHGWGVRSNKTPLYHAIDRFSLKFYDRVICVSDQLLKECLAAGVPVGNCCQIDNAIDLANYSSLLDKREARRQLGVDLEKPVVVAVGRLSREKAFNILIQAFADLLESGLDATLLIAGEGSERDALQDQITGFGCEDSIRLAGHISDPRIVYAAADVFALSSTSEGLPNSLLEAMACGVAIVATAVGAVPDVISDEFNGLLIESGRAEPLTLALNRLLVNQEVREQLAAEACATIETEYSFKRRMQKVSAVYDSVLSGRSSTTDQPNSLEPESPTFNGSSSIPVSSGATPFNSSFECADSDAWHSGTGTLIKTATVRAAAPSISSRGTIRVELTSTPELWNDYLTAKGCSGFYQQAAWLRVLQHGSGHQPVCLQAMSGGELVGVLPMVFVNTQLFGRFLVSLPYLNSAGIVADSSEAAEALVDRAIGFAEQLDVRYLELRHETAFDHPKLTQVVTDKVHMRLALPKTADELWNSLKSKLRSQIRKPLNNKSLTVHWGGRDLLDEFYSVFTINMRDLGTPPFSRRLFVAMIDEFPGESEFCCVRLDGQPVASGLLIHGPGVTQVPSASSLRKFNSTSANMLMYWHLLVRSIERGQQTFDFGRSSKGAGTHKFKAQWGAEEFPAVWQHFVRDGEATDMRPDNSRFRLMIRTWQRLPVWFTKMIGPSIVRGIP